MTKHLIAGPEFAVDFTAPKEGKYDHLPTTSAKIRAMHADGMARGDIARALGKRYQHVRNVLTNPPKKS